MSARLAELAGQAARIAEEGRYRAPSGRVVEIGDAVAAAVAGTVVHGPDPVGYPPAEPVATVFEVTPEASLEAAGRMVAASPEPVAVLNFASARNPGGGFLRGAQAQEEYLCRNSALYESLRTVMGVFYDIHRADRDPFYSHRVIHTPGVPVFRGEDNALLEEPYSVGFLTCAAPNAGVIAQSRPAESERVPDVLHERAARVLQVAAAGGYRRLVLGAWGCGVFRCDPAQVAGAFREHLGPGGAFGGRFREVAFAVLDRRADSPTRAAFTAAFSRVADV